MAVPNSSLKNAVAHGQGLVRVIVGDRHRTYSDEQVANRNVGDFGWEIAHEAVSRRPPISLDTIVARTEGYTYAASVWDSSLVQGLFSVAPCQTVGFAFLSVTEGGGRADGKQWCCRV
jgi:hypothetical protein